MNTVLEILEAMIEAEGPVRGWVLRDDEETWNECIITGAEMVEDPCMDVFFSYGIAYNRASLDNPNLSYKPLGPWVNDWAKFRAVNPCGDLWEFSNRPTDVTKFGWWKAEVGTAAAPISEGHDTTNCESSLEKRVAYKPLGPWENDWAKFRAVNTDGELWEFSYNPGMVLGGWQSDPLTKWRYISEGHDPTNWENSLEERTRKTRPMTAREFARFVGENMGQYLYRSKSWREDVWCMDPNIDSELKRVDYLYAHNTDGDLEWMELPQVEAE